MEVCLQIGNLYGQGVELPDPKRAPRAVIGQTISHYRIIEKLDSLGFALEARQRLRVSCDFIRKEFQCHKPTQASVFSV